MSILKIMFTENPSKTSPPGVCTISYCCLLYTSLLVGGSYGMAGAISLNITGAKALGFPYIEVGCIDGIYPIVAAKHTTPVFHPFSAHNIEQQLTPTIEHVSACLLYTSKTSCL